ncbi:MAG: GAF and ANTAR domain-containing protein [Actinomycetota bacterium]|nr:GAF and ANTAR domain-containing protein [Actinomycetota bacterium]
MTSEESLAVLVRVDIEREAPDDSRIGTADTLMRLCKAAVRVLPASGAAVSLITDVGPAGIIASSSSWAATAEELQFTLGESPGWDAFEARVPVSAPDLAAVDEIRWPGYAASALEHGVGSVFAFPLLSGTSRMGVLDIYRDESSSLSEESLAYARACCSVATAELLDGQEEAGSGSIPLGFDGALDSQFAIHQAQGMVMVQLGVNLSESMSRMRAHAYANDLALGQVARNVVGRTLDLSGDQR